MVDSKQLLIIVLCEDGWTFKLWDTMYSFVRIEDEGSTFPITLLNNSRHMEVEIKSFIISKKNGSFYLKKIL